MTIMTDTGASRLIADGRIKVKNGTGISRITRTGVSFEDGTETMADVIIFATGYILYLSHDSSLTNIFLVWVTRGILYVRFAEMLSHQDARLYGASTEKGS